MSDFFVSYTSADRNWAEWIAWQLEEAGFIVLIQAWDFTGNWVIRMDQAMRSSARTIIVLSPAYLRALYTQPEWANAIRLDPTGEKDLLVPVRVQPVEPEGLLAQIVYVDLVGRDEAEAAELLLKRARGERGKPSTRPLFPSQAAQHRASTASKPVYPAFDEDTKRLVRIRSILVDWRRRYSGEADELRAAGEKARRWSHSRPALFDDDAAAVFRLAARVMRDFQEIRLDELEFARAYGLLIHPTVFSGGAFMHVAMVERSIERRLTMQLQPSNYDYEMAARVLESAYALVGFELDALPRGYLADDGTSPPGDIRGYGALFIARIDNSPRLHLINVERSPTTLGTFAARALRLDPICAQRTEDGLLELLATDYQFIYRWANTLQPVMQYACAGVVEAGAFLDRTPHSPALTVHYDGSIRLLDADGGMNVLWAAGESLQCGSVWRDPLDERGWRAFAVTREGRLICHPLDGETSGVEAAVLWNCAQFGIAPETHWWDNYHMAVQDLAGLPCLLVTRQHDDGEGVVFLDPLSLAPIRRPLFVPGFVSGATLACGRWLAAVFLSQHEAAPRVELWDVRSSTPERLGSWYRRDADTYYPFVTRESEDDFDMVFVSRPFDRELEHWLCRFRYPSGEVEELAKYVDVDLLPVS
jgi:hypothetical protein